MLAVAFGLTPDGETAGTPPWPTSGWRSLRALEGFDRAGLSARPVRVTRRYAGAPFGPRAIETFDRAQTKRCKVYVDGRELHLRTFPRDSGGTETRFENQGDPAFYDPSIADVWTLSP